LLRRNCKNRN